MSHLAPAAVHGRAQELRRGAQRCGVARSDAVWRTRAAVREHALPQGARTSKLRANNIRGTQ
jgi:hypothetical protein